MNKKFLYLLVLVIGLGTVAGMIYFSQNGHLANRKAVGKTSVPQPTPDTKKTRVSHVSGSKTQKLDVLYLPPEMAPASLRKILGVEKVSFRERLNLVDRLSHKLSDAEKRALYYYLKNGENNDDTKVLKNDMINALRAQEPPPPELTDVLLDIFHDKNQDIVMRSYALQHLRPWYEMEKMYSQAIVDAFHEGAEEHSTEISGVALLAMNYLAEKKVSGFDVQTVSTQAVNLAEDESASVLSRISAVSICGRLNSTEALPVVRTLAESSDSVTLRVSAIAALGSLGGTDDLKLLQKLAQGPKPFAAAAQAAIQKLKMKI